MSTCAGCPDGFANALWLVAAMSVAGLVHVLWLKSALSRQFCQPLDGGARLGGQRIFGANKQVRGLLAMPPAAATAFASVVAARDVLPEWINRGLWDLPVAEYAALGFTAGLAFMLAELPNSFLKRRLDVAPGEAPNQRWLKPVCFALDRVDSTLGVMLALSLAVPVSAATWLWALVLGPLPHAAFSVWLHLSGEKQRVL